MFKVKGYITAWIVRGNWFHAFAGTAISILIIPQGVKTISHRLFAFCYTRSNRQITCVFLGTETEVTIKEDEPFYEVAMIYCLPGSAVQKYARERKIPIKPISEFRMEDYQWVITYQNGIK